MCGNRQNRHFDETIVPQDSNNFVKLFRLEAHSPRQIIVFEAARAMYVDLVSSNGKKRVINMARQ